MQDQLDRDGVHTYLRDDEWYVFEKGAPRLTASTSSDVASLDEERGAEVSTDIRASLDEML